MSNSPYIVNVNYNLIS